MADPGYQTVGGRFRAAAPSPRVIACGCAVLALGTGLAATTALPVPPILLWNASPSSIVGLYKVGGRNRLKAGDMVVAWAPPNARRIAAQRGYLPMRVPLIKQVAASAGQRVCAKGDAIFIGKRAVAKRRAHDPSGRPMPSWSGCLRLSAGELFLLSPAAPLAFDGRYFGITHASQVVGKAWLLWRPRWVSHHG